MLKKSAFTLAEVLIVLGIIGIIAEITIPTLVNNAQTQMKITSLKKMYSTLSQAYLYAVQENGTPDGWIVNPTSSGDAANQLMNKFIPYLKVLHNCQNNVGCFPESGYKYLNKEGIDNYYYRTDLSKIQLSDGSFFAIAPFSYSCSFQLGNTQKLSNGCAELLVDINGLKKPNVWGKDGFSFLLTNSGIIPGGINDITASYYKFDNDCLIVGGGCTAWVIYNNNMDYMKCPDMLSWTGKHSCS